MARHQGSSLSFEYPRDWQDKSEVRYEAPPRSGATGERSPGRAVLRRDHLRSEESLVAFVERTLRALASADGFVIRDVAETRVGDHPASLVRFASVEASVPYEHRTLFVALTERGVAMLTVSAPRTELAQLDPLFERMLASVRVGPT